jgi:hypothetical protein
MAGLRIAVLLKLRVLPSGSYLLNYPRELTRRTVPISLPKLYASHLLTFEQMDDFD